MLTGGIVLAVVLAIRGSDDDDAVAGPATTTTTTLPLAPGADELLALAERSRSLELHLVYEQVGGDPAQGSVRLEVWRKGDRGAEALTTTAASSGTTSTIEYRNFRLPEGNTHCVKLPDEDWRCEAVLSVATEAGEPAGLFDAAIADLAGREVTPRDDKVGERDARCFTIASADETYDMCLTDDGIVVRLERGGTRIELSTLEREVDDAAFELPAEVTATPGAGTTAG